MEKYKSMIMDLLDRPMVLQFITLIIALIVIGIFISVIKKQLNKTIKDIDNKYRARKAVNMMGYLFFVAVALFVYSDQLGNVGMALGVAGAGIAFALQEVIVSFAGWVNILIAGTVGVGQRVKVGDVKGDIIDIGVMSTTIMEVGDWVDGDLYNGRIISLANSFVFKEKIHNYSAEYPFLWDEITIPLRTESDYKLAREVFLQVVNEVCGDFTAKSEEQWSHLANKYRVENAQVQPMVTLKFDENWITFTLRYIVDYKRRRATKDAIYTKLLDEIVKYDAIIMIATSTLEITNIKEE